MAANEMPVLPVAWTLTYELVFYVFFCVFLLLNWTIGLILAAVWAVLILATLLGYINPATKVVGILLSPLNLEFFLGCIAGYFATGLKWRPESWMAYTTLLFGLGMLALSWWNAFLKYAFFAQNDVLQFGIPFFVIILSIVSLDTLRPRKPAQGLLRIGLFLGEASYSIYLVHFLVIVSVGIVHTKIALTNPALAFLSAISLSILVASFLYYYVERPLLRYLAGVRNRGVKFSQ